ncbi:MAG: hypothetical protein Q7T98_09015 [Polaromonas sp.]|nr:hypothetical protein [Polaromonas sp.]
MTDSTGWLGSVQDIHVFSVSADRPVVSAGAEVMATMIWNTSCLLQCNIHPLMH